MHDLITIETGTSPVVVASPHSGMSAPGIATRLVERNGDPYATSLARHVARLAEGSFIGTRMSRLWCDVCQPPDSRATDPAHAAIPTIDRTGARIYGPNGEPDDPERGRRLTVLYRPWHELTDMLQRLAVERHGRGILLETHSHRDGDPFRVEGDLTAMRLAKSLGDLTETPVTVRAEGHDADRARVRLSVRTDLLCDPAMADRVARTVAQAVGA